ncbi:MAG: hypothetical protein HKN00_11820 [Flavobacteriaceae bacterium]|nr:hypothetical protein [Bacteroidia bacterium]MBT8288028.1 hypothetical protein [Bacteroidia bacterium]NNF75866.1 hypothetical protein [Flavobacteriaceae bacterium]NNK73091.1 hypothetical protein [Flavobacteriaceae bacterium]
MDELELLKKDWKRQEAQLPRLSYDEIYKMILKRSSSIVKWIFIISLLEFGFWTLISVIFKDSEAMTRFETSDARHVLIPMTIVGYVILAYFFYLFFRNYRTISVTDNAKKLMEKILKTRRTVKQYVAFNLIYLFISTFVALGILMKSDSEFGSRLEEAAADGELFKVYAVTILVTLFALAVAIGLILAFYYLIYGLLLKRLNRNYRELKKLET